MQIYKVLGVMSGTSLDGLDLAYCEFVKDKTWTYKILASATISYSDRRENILKNGISLTSEELVALDAKFGKYIGEEVKKFCVEHNIQPDLISSHGHTIFHQPQRGFTLQIGSGAHIYAETGIPVVCDFRKQDVALGGQGAPLVPVGDKLLFGEYDACLNLGGFANISAQIDKKRIAWDICAVNTVLNLFARELGLKYDEFGVLARSGKRFEPLYNDLLDIPFYQELPPRSLGVEWVKETLLPILNRYLIPVEDKLHTYVLHIANHIGMTIGKAQASKVLVTGGGTYHQFLMEKIKEHSDAMIIIPDDATIQFKEALIFAFLGVLRVRNENNVLKSVTGASMDHCSGVVYGNLNIQ